MEGELSGEGVRGEFSWPAGVVGEGVREEVTRPAGVVMGWGYGGVEEGVGLGGLRWGEGLEVDAALVSLMPTRDGSYS